MERGWETQESENKCEKTKQKPGKHTEHRYNDMMKWHDQDTIILSLRFKSCLRLLHRRIWWKTQSSCNDFVLDIWRPLCNIKCPYTGSSRVLCIYKDSVFRYFKYYEIDCLHTNPGMSWIWGKTLKRFDSGHEPASAVLEGCSHLLFNN